VAELETRVDAGIHSSDNSESGSRSECLRGLLDGIWEFTVAEWLTEQASDPRIKR